MTSPLATLSDLAAMLACSPKTARRRLWAVIDHDPSLVFLAKMRFSPSDLRTLRAAFAKAGLPVFDAPPPPPGPLHADWRTLMKNAKRRAAIIGKTCTLTEDCMRTLVERAGGKCEVSGIPFRYKRGGQGNGKTAPFAPSIDRLDNAAGYTLENCRLVCWCVNAAMGAWGDEVFWEMVHAAARHKPQEMPDG